MESDLPSGCAVIIPNHINHLGILLSAKHSNLHPNSLYHRSPDDFKFVTSPPYSFSVTSGGDSAAASSINFMSASGLLKKLFMLRYSISTMRTIVASPEKLHRLSREL